MADEKLARIYMKVNNKHGAFIPGVGARNITAQEWEGLPDHVKKSVDASGFFRKPKASKKADQEGAEEPQDEPTDDVEVVDTDEEVEEPAEPVEGSEDETEEPLEGEEE